MLGLKRTAYAATARRRELGSIGHFQAKHHLQWLAVRKLGHKDIRASGRVMQAPGVMIGFKFEGVTRILLERHGFAVVVGLDQDGVDGFGLHGSCFPFCWAWR